MAYHRQHSDWRRPIRTNTTQNITFFVCRKSLACSLSWFACARAHAANDWVNEPNRFEKRVKLFLWSYLSLFSSIVEQIDRGKRFAYELILWFKLEKYDKKVCKLFYALNGIEWFFLLGESNTEERYDRTLWLHRENKQIGNSKNIRTISVYL